MPTCTASYNDNSFRQKQTVFIVYDSTQGHICSLSIYTPTHTRFQAIGLLKDFFQHKMWIATFFYLTEVDINGLNRRILLPIEQINNLQIFTQAHHGYISIFQVNHFIGEFNYRTGIRTQEEFIFSDAYNQRTLLACRYNLIGFTPVKQGYSIGTNHLMKRHLHGSQRVKVLLHLHIFYQLNKYFRIRF